MMDRMTVDRSNLLGPEPTLLPDEAGQIELGQGIPPRDVAALHPTSSAAWAAVAAEAAAADQNLEWYAFARVGYHRGLDALRRSGWKGHGPIPWEHEPNQGFLRCLHELAGAAAAIGEQDEAQRCAQFLRDSSQTAADVLEGQADRLRP
jgi:Protein of unknown function (DUF3151)